METRNGMKWHEMADKAREDISFFGLHKLALRFQLGSDSKTEVCLNSAQL